jgi:hypothetical protein
VVGCLFTVFGSALLYHVRASESYLDICLFKEVGDFSDPLAVIREGSHCLFLLSVLSVGFVLHVSFQSCYEMDKEFVNFCYGKDFLPFSFFSVVRGSVVILLVR